MSGGIFAVGQSIGNIHMPFREGTIYRFYPFADTSFTCIYFLATTYEANYYRPILMPVQTGNKKLGFRNIKISNILLSLHEVGSLCNIPGSLCLIKNSYVFKGWR